MCLQNDQLEHPNRYERPLWNTLFASCESSKFTLGLSMRCSFPSCPASCPLAFRASKSLRPFLCGIIIWLDVISGSLVSRSESTVSCKLHSVLDVGSVTLLVLLPFRVQHRYSRSRLALRIDGISTEARSFILPRQLSETVAPGWLRRLVMQKEPTDWY